MAYGFRRPTCLRLQTLGERALPSVTWADDGNHGVTITGDQADDSITITENGSGGFTVETDEWSEDFDNSFTSVVVLSEGGADDVTYQTAEGLADAVTRTLEVRLGNRSDTFTADLGDLPAGSDVDVTVYGGNGHDTLTVTGGDASGDLTLALFGGNGKDWLWAEFAGAVGGVFDVTLDGGNGKDTVVATLSADAAAEGSTETPDVSVHVLGGNGKDDLTLTVDGDGADGLGEAFEIDGGRGRDSFEWTPEVVTVLDAEANA